MTAHLASRVPTLWHGREIVQETATRLTTGRDTLVIADSAVRISLPAHERSTTIRVDASHIDVEEVIRLTNELTRRRPDVIVAVGGGSVLDASKLAALGVMDRRVLDYAIGHAATSGLTVLPDGPPPVDIVAVPTTLGTSSETNTVAVLRHPHGYRLIIGRSLRPRHAVLDPCALATLTPAAVREGAMEAFLRLAGASTSAGRTRRERSDAQALGAALLETAAEDTASDSGRLRLARLSAATQRCAALRGHDPFSARHWYLANEVAFALGVRKMLATAAVIPAVWRRIGSEDVRWGDQPSLEDFWRRTTRALALPTDPPSGIAELLDRWALPRPPRPSDTQMGRIAAATEKWWGDRSPVLRGLVAADFSAVLREAHWGATTDGGGHRTATSRDEGGE